MDMNMVARLRTGVEVELSRRVVKSTNKDFGGGVYGTKEPSARNTEK